MQLTHQPLLNPADEYIPCSMQTTLFVLMRLGGLRTTPSLVQHYIHSRLPRQHTNSGDISLPPLPGG